MSRERLPNRRAVEIFELQASGLRFTCTVGRFAGGRLAELEDAVADINERLRMAAGDHFTLPPIEVPQPEIDTDAPRQALVSFDDDWAAATRALIARKVYGGGAA